MDAPLLLCNQLFYGAATDLFPMALLIVPTLIEDSFTKFNGLFGPSNLLVHDYKDCGFIG